MTSRVCSDLCWQWNAATNPAVLRTDDEHKAKREEARRILAELRHSFREGIDFVESDSGRMLPIARTGGI